MCLSILKDTKQQSGFTLIEVVIVIVILGIISAYGAMMLQQGFDMYFKGKDVNNAGWQEFIAYNRMVHDLQGISGSTFISSLSDDSTFRFTDRQLNTVIFTLSDSTLTRSSTPLADGFSSLTFTYLDATGTPTTVPNDMRYIKVTPNITQGNVDYSTPFIVFLRNTP